MPGSTRGREVKLYGMMEMNFLKCRDSNGRRGGFRRVCEREWGSGAGSCAKIGTATSAGETSSDS